MVAVYCQEMSSSMVASSEDGFIKGLLSTEDEFINGCYLQKRVHNGCYLQKMDSSMVAIYRR